MDAFAHALFMNYDFVQCAHSQLPDRSIDFVCLLCTRIPHQNGILVYSTVWNFFPSHFVGFFFGHRNERFHCPLLHRRGEKCDRCLSACGTVTPWFLFPSVVLSGENQVSGLTAYQRFSYVGCEHIC
jgi:hypothetical protein